MWFAANITGQAADYARNSGVPTITVRKFCQCGGQLISAAGLIALPYIPEGPHQELLCIVRFALVALGREREG